jgi:hypothetical protein
MKLDIQPTGLKGEPLINMYETSDKYDSDISVNRVANPARLNYEGFILIEIVITGLGRNYPKALRYACLLYAR